jgi:hypothetical protein
MAPQQSAFIVDKSGAMAGLGISHDRRLMQWPKLGWGGDELYPNLPGREHWIGRDDHGGIIVIASGDSAGSAVRVFRWEKNDLVEIEIIKSRHTFPRHGAVSGGAVLLAYSDKIEAISLENGQRLTEQEIPTLPPFPSLHFDGVKIRVEDSSRVHTYLHEKWKLGDNTWPHLFIPDQISLENGILRVLVRDQYYAFDPIKITWTKSKQGYGRYKPFEETSFSPGHGMNLKRANLGAEMEIWLDPRGLLHLRDPRDKQSLSWSILLSTSATSIWNVRFDLCTYEPRLRFPVPDSLPDVQQNHISTLLKDFLSAPTNS